MKIQHNIHVKRSKLFLIGGRTPLPKFFNSKFCCYSNFCPRHELPSPNFSMVSFVTNTLFQFLPKGWIPLPNSSMASLVSIPLWTRGVSIQKNLPPYIWLLREFAWNCIPMFKPRSWDYLFFLTSTFQPREWALPHTHTHALGHSLSWKVLVRKKDDPMTTE